MKTSLLLLAVLSLPGCWWTVQPVLPAVAPGPFTPPDQLLFTVPEGYRTAALQVEVLRHRDEELPKLEALHPERAAQIRRHEIVTGMTSQEVVWSFLAHPTRTQDHGPPGSHILLWDSLPWEPGRYWVRTDQWGHVAAAGRF